MYYFILEIIIESDYYIVEQIGDGIWRWDYNADILYK